MPSDNQTEILGVRLDKASWESVIANVLEAVNLHRLFHIVTLNGEIALSAHNDPSFRNVLNSADLIITDSTNIFWASRAKGLRTEKTPGSELTIRLCKVAEERSLSVFLIGGQGDVPKKAAENLQELFPGLRVVGSSNKNPDDPTLLDDLTAVRPNIVFVAFGSPKQEIWIAKNRQHLSPAVYIGVGGTFDMLSGSKPRSPRWIRSLNLEWFWRLLIEPKRIGRVIKATLVFPLTFILKDLLHLD